MQYILLLSCCEQCNHSSSSSFYLQDALVSASFPASKKHPARRAVHPRDDFPILDRLIDAMSVSLRSVCEEVEQREKSSLLGRQQSTEQHDQRVQLRFDSMHQHQKKAKQHESDADFLMSKSKQHTSAALLRSLPVSVGRRFCAFFNGMLCSRDYRHRRCRV